MSQRGANAVKRMPKAHLIRIARIDRVERSEFDRDWWANCLSRIKHGQNRANLFQLYQPASFSIK
jgi:hypothetical protein